MLIAAVAVGIVCAVRPIGHCLLQAGRAIAARSRRQGGAGRPEYRQEAGKRDRAQPRDREQDDPGISLRRS